MRIREKRKKMKQEIKTTPYIKKLCRRNHKYGVCKDGYKGWWIEPIYDDIDRWESSDVCERMKTTQVWVRKNGRYGYLDVEKREEIVPCEYGRSLNFSDKEEGCCIAWKDYKAGVINKRNEVVIPFIYDEIYQRFQHVDNPNPKKIIREDGTEFIIPYTKKLHIFKGYACFTDEGEEQAYDVNMQPCEFEDWEREFMDQKYEYKWRVPENEGRTVEDIEELIRNEYRTLIGMGYGHGTRCDIADREVVDKLEETIKNHILDRRHILDKSWSDDPDRAKKIARVNDLLMRSVAKAVRIGKRTAKSLQWMEKVANKCEYYVDVSIHPQWENDKSCYDYKPKESSKKKERERLEEQEFEDSCFHIINIIAEMGTGGVVDDKVVCFSAWSSEYDPNYWDVRSLTLDDGESWDEGISYPIYMDVYFTHPFHQLYFDNYYYANTDIVNINDFRIKVDVRLETKEMDKVNY